MNHIFPAVYSTLCPVALSSLISMEYGLEEVQCKLLVRGVGDTYLVETSEHRFILRAYRSSHRSFSQIKDEVELLLALKDADVSVSYPVKNISSETILKINAVEGERYAVLFSYAHGRVMPQLNEKQLYNLGNEMARFHNVSSDLQLSNERWDFSSETTLISPLKNLRSVFKEIPEDYAWLENKVAQIQVKLAQSDTSGFSKGYCHFDFMPKNFHFEDDSVTLFDFDFMGYGWLVNDIMTFWQYLMLEVYTGKITDKAANDSLDTFLKGYRQSRFVSDEEVALIPYLAFGFWLFYMNFHTTHDQFSVFTQLPHVKSYIRILKNIAEKYWEKESSEFMST
ncbi:MAG: phosphotransferase [Chryseobacterium sp.]|jgi:Ser/Thr protein kinase RdoA (MazF antagonist)|uniref:phosphotransferase enzyme family protein n=1 Tax=Chryseobacterium sp. TaxID=1871047 RepID=UPI00281F9835|nr:phosphotransferase [Chryseobacterium sp.]MDR2238071.1 phosphotransferase [Chryseobacterium sp.]